MTNGWNCSGSYPVVGFTIIVAELLDYYQRVIYLLKRL
jgi:hypothetical protein